MAPLFLKKVPQYCWGRVWGFEMRVVIAYQKDSQTLMAKMRGKWCCFYDYCVPRRRLLSMKSIACLRKMITWISFYKEKPDLWLLMDRNTQADDNAEHLYRYIRRCYPRRRVKFVLSQSSCHWARLREEGFDLIPYGGRIHRACIWKASKLISSHGGMNISDAWQQTKQNPFVDFVFLDHGVIKNDMSRSYRRGHGVVLSDGRRKMDLLVTAAKDEFLSVACSQSPYSLFPFQIKMTGFARHDALLETAKKKASQRVVIIMPTWRRNASSWDCCYLPMSKQRKERFLSSNYFSFWRSFLVSSKLKDLLLQYDYSAIFFPHANSAPFLAYWGVPRYITCMTMADCMEGIQKVLATGSLLITDYSSIAFDMAYIKKPVLYYQFDETEYSLVHYRKGYFDYLRDGFGPVARTEESLLTCLEYLLLKGCRPEQQYLQRMESAFPFRDGQCCERIYQSICDLDKPRSPNDFDRRLLITYAENAELRGEINLARKYWLRLLFHENGDLFALRDNFCRLLLS
ncbi:MAG: CDP-glycerol glycerophosphotransferase family protein [Holosporales bacterium]|nr:CDP-glycerol glycerophosphotransferase family protein [Holosporales bacterium]